MAQPYRTNEPGGIKIEATGQIIYPGDAEWPAYAAWLAEQPGPETPGGPVPPGTGLLPFEPPVMSLAQMRTEMLARLDALIQLRRGLGTVSAAGHTWQLTDSFVLAVALHAALFPPVPAGFTLPNSSRVQVPINEPDFAALVAAISARFIAANTNYAALVSAINASASPLTINLEAGWPP